MFHGGRKCSNIIQDSKMVKNAQGIGIFFCTCTAWVSKARRPAEEKCSTILPISIIQHFFSRVLCSNLSIWPGSKVVPGCHVLHPCLWWSCSLATINCNRFPMVLTPLDHHHLMLWKGPTIGFNDFSMVLDHSTDGAMVSINRNLQCSNF